MKNHEIEGIIAPAAPDHPFGKSNKRLFAFTINSLKLGFNSVTVMLVITLALSYTILFTSYPWRELAALDVPLWIMRYAARLPEYIAGPEKKPLVILGSSLIIAPSQQLNDVAEGPVDAHQIKSDWRNSCKPLTHYSDRQRQLEFRSYWWKCP